MRIKTIESKFNYLSKTFETRETSFPSSSSDSILILSSSVCSPRSELSKFFSAIIHTRDSEVQPKKGSCQRKNPPFYGIGKTRSLFFSDYYLYSYLSYVWKKKGIF